MLNLIKKIIKIKIFVVSLVAFLWLMKKRLQR